MLTLFLEALDQSIVGTAMPRIIQELHGLDRYSWVVTAYILVSTIMIPVVGKLSDLFGRKWFLLVGTLLFLLGSGLAGASHSMNQLILFRGVQGLGTGIGIALIGTVMADLFPPEERARWGGLFGMVYGVASLLGPTLGGWLSEHGPLVGNLVTDATRWRWVFYINLPIGLIALLLVLVCLPARLSGSAGGWTGWASLRRIDFLGSITCAAATICLILGLTWGSVQTSAWTSPAVGGILLAGVVFLVLFLVVERSVSEPILPLDLFRHPIFRASAALGLLQSMVVLGLVLYLPLFFQGVLGLSPTGTGLVMTPLSLSMVTGAMLSGVAIDRLQRYRSVAVVAALLMSAGVALIMLMNEATSIPLAIACLMLAGVGIGVFFSLPMVAVQNAMPASQLGVVTATVRYLSQIGATLGIAIVATAITSSVSGDLLSRLPVTAADRHVLLGALQHGFGAVLVFAVLALVVTLCLQERLQPAREDGQPDEPAVQDADGGLTPA